MIISSFYLFKNLSNDQVQSLQRRLQTFSESMRGLILLGTEGINATVSGEPDVITEFKAVVRECLDSPIHFKDSQSPRHPFREFVIQVRKEIVTLGRPDFVPVDGSGHLTPQEWHHALGEPDVVVLDTRNTYETAIGVFENAVDMKLDEFREFPQRLRELNLPKDKKVLMYCTGGIRCEKAILEAREQGYENVFQLQGGILEYLREFPEQKFKGECFVFDYRVAVDQHLRPSQHYRFCPHCGQPGQETLNCKRCGVEAIVCKSCLEESSVYATCSKNCAHHEEIQSGSCKPHRQELERRKNEGPTLL